MTFAAIIETKYKRKRLLGERWRKGGKGGRREKEEEEGGQDRE